MVVFLLRTAFGFEHREYYFTFLQRFADVSWNLEDPEFDEYQRHLSASKKLQRLKESPGSRMSALE